MASPSAGTGGILATSVSPADLTMTALPASGPALAPGVYTGNITVESPGADNSPVTVPITLTVNDYDTVYPYANPVSVHCRETIGTDPSNNTLDVLKPVLLFGGEPVLSTTVVGSGWLTYNPATSIVTLQSSQPGRGPV